MHTDDYSQSQGDHTLFFKHSLLMKIIVLIAYVDDIIVIGWHGRNQRFEESASKWVWDKGLGEPKILF